MSNFRSSLILFLMVLGAGAYFYFIERHQKTTDDIVKIEKNLFTFAVDKVVSLQITNGEQKVVLQKEGAVWKIKAPVVAEADAPAVQQMLDGLEFLQSRRTITGTELKNQTDLLKQAGLAPAATRIDFSTGPNEQDKFVLLLGRKTAVSEFVYARTSEQANAPIFLISTINRDGVDKKLDDLRSRQVLRVESDKVQKITLRNSVVGGASGAEYELTKSGQAWNLVKPLSARADKKKIQDWLQQIDQLTVKTFVTEDGSNLNQFGLSTPAAQISLQSDEKGNGGTLLLGSAVAERPTEVYAKRLKGDTVFTLLQTSVQPLLSGLPEARDKHVLSFDPDSITSVRWESKGKFIGATKEKESWTLTSTPPQKAESAMITDFLRQLATLETLAFVKDTATDLKPYGLDKVQHRLVLSEKKGESTESYDLLLGKADKQQIYVKNSREPFIYSLPLATVEAWPKENNDWRSRQIFDLESAKVTALEITPSTGAKLQLKRDATGLVTDAPGQIVNAERANLLLDKLVQLRAQKWLGAVQPAYALAKPTLKITLQATKEITLLIGAELSPELTVAQIAGEAESFALSNGDIKELKVSPLDPAPAKP